MKKFEHHVKEALDWEDTFPLRGKDGSFRWFLSRMNVIRDESGKAVRIFGTNTDITQQRQMADELRKYAADLSEADRRKNEFLAMLPTNSATPSPQSATPYKSYGSRPAGSVRDRRTRPSNRRPG